MQHGLQIRNPYIRVVNSNGKEFNVRKSRLEPAQEGPFLNSDHSSMSRYLFSQLEIDPVDRTWFNKYGLPNVGWGRSDVLRPKIIDLVRRALDGNSAIHACTQVLTSNVDLKCISVYLLSFKGGVVTSSFRRLINELYGDQIVLGWSLTEGPGEAQALSYPADSFNTGGLFVFRSDDAAKRFAASCECISLVKIEVDVLEFFRAVICYSLALTKMAEHFYQRSIVTVSLRRGAEGEQRTPITLKTGPNATGITCTSVVPVNRLQTQERPWFMLTNAEIGKPVCCALMCAVIIRGLCNIPNSRGADMPLSAGPAHPKCSSKGAADLREKPITMLHMTPGGSINATCSSLQTNFQGITYYAELLLKCRLVVLEDISTSQRCLVVALHHQNNCKAKAKKWQIQVGVKLPNINSGLRAFGGWKKKQSELETGQKNITIRLMFENESWSIYDNPTGRGAGKSKPRGTYAFLRIVTVLEKNPMMKPQFPPMS